MDFALQLRNLNNALFLALGITVPQVPQQQFAGPLGFDIGELPYTELKAYTKPRDVKTLQLNLVHVTAVKTGFGVRSTRVKYWLLQLQNKGLDALPVGLAGICKLYNIPPDEMLARRVAKWERLRNTPYHQIGASDGDVLDNRRLSQKSWHGDAGGNEGVGTAFDCAPDEKLSSFKIETFRAAMARSLQRQREVSLVDEILVAPHRATSAARRGDPGPMIWREVVMPVVSKTLGVRADYEYKRNNGLWIPTNWDAQAHFDSKGNRVRS